MDNYPPGHASGERQVSHPLECPCCPAKWTAHFTEADGGLFAEDGSDACPRGCEDESGASVVGVFLKEKNPPALSHGMA